MNHPPFLLVVGTLLALPLAARADEAAVPQSVAELWADFDPRRDPLEVEVIREWQEDGGTYRHVRYLIGTFKGTPARMAAIYGFPTATAAPAATKLPAVMHIHGGGQRAFLHEVKFLVRRGYAALSVNWGGDGDGTPPFNSVEGAQPGDPNTDWGRVDPSQLNAAAYSSILPGPKQFFEDHEHPKNNNWYLLTLGCRRGLTFLEQQPEVDPARLGVHGYSMGGNLTMYVAGSDARVKAAVPAVGGAGWRWQSHDFGDGLAPALDRVRGDVEIFRRTLSFESYAPHIHCPLLHRSSTNDFHGWMDDVYRTNALISDQPLRYSWTPHFNHRLSAEVEVTMPLWFDHYLKGGPALPETPASVLRTATPDRVPQLEVNTAGSPWPAARCAIYYSVDADPRARFWRSAEVSRDGDRFTAALPLHTLDLPLFAFANVHYTLPDPVSLAPLPGRAAPVSEVCLSSQLHHLSAGEVQAAGLAATLQPTAVIDDFGHGLRDWYQHNLGNAAHYQAWTRKLTDPAWRGQPGQELVLTLLLPETNTLTFVITENEWRRRRGPTQTYVCTRTIDGSPQPQSVRLTRENFRNSDGWPGQWGHVDVFGICAHYQARGEAQSPPPRWSGPPLQLQRLEWR